MYKITYKYTNRLETTRGRDKIDLYILCQAIKEMGGIIIQIQSIMGDIFNINLT